MRPRQPEEGARTDPSRIPHLIASARLKNEEGPWFETNTSCAPQRGHMTAILREAPDSGTVARPQKNWR
jgi:hypothetical protein